jgi:hypothetical protein
MRQLKNGNYAAAALAAVLAVACGPGSLVAKAGEKKKLVFCANPQAILREVDDCEQNNKFLKGATKCADDLEAQVKTAGSLLAQVYKSADKGENQAKNFGASNTDYKVSSATLRYLIAIHERAVQDIRKYKNYLVQPEDVDNPDIAGSNPQEFADSVNCFGYSKDSLDAIAGIVDLRKKNLERVKKLADDNASSSAGHENDSTSLTTGQPAPGKPGLKGEPGSAAPKGKNWRDSDISGTKNKKQQESK